VFAIESFRDLARSVGLSPARCSALLLGSVAIGFVSIGRQCATNRQRNAVVRSRAFPEHSLRARHSKQHLLETFARRGKLPDKQELIFSAIFEIKNGGRLCSPGN
jgi:hypothetical protein